MTDPYAAYPPSAPATSPARRRRPLAPWWVALIVLGAGAVLAFAWFVLGGLPFTSHAAYGRVPVPGAGTLALPAATVRINFEEDGVVGENDSADMPADLQVVVTGANGILAVHRLSENLFSSTTGTTGFVPYGEVAVPSPGDYQVTTSATQASTAVSPRITLGEPPWNPFGPPIAGALVILAPFAILALSGSSSCRSAAPEHRKSSPGIRPTSTSPAPHRRMNALPRSSG